LFTANARRGSRRLRRVLRGVAQSFLLVFPGLSRQFPWVYFSPPRR